jgi:hypothetical protein
MAEARRVLDVHAHEEHWDWLVTLPDGRRESGVNYPTEWEATLDAARFIATWDERERAMRREREREADQGQRGRRRR